MIENFPYIRHSFPCAELQHARTRLVGQTNRLALPTETIENRSWKDLLNYFTIPLFCHMLPLRGVNCDAETNSVC